MQTHPCPMCCAFAFVGCTLLWAFGFHWEFERCSAWAYGWMDHGCNLARLVFSSMSYGADRFETWMVRPDSQHRESGTGVVGGPPAWTTGTYRVRVLRLRQGAPRGTLMDTGQRRARTPRPGRDRDRSRVRDAIGQRGAGRQSPHGERISGVT